MFPTHSRALTHILIIYIYKYIYEALKKGKKKDKKTLSETGLWCVHFFSVGPGGKGRNTPGEKWERLEVGTASGKACGSRWAGALPRRGGAGRAHDGPMRSDKFAYDLGGTAVSFGRTGDRGYRL